VFPKARVVALAVRETHAFLAAEVDAYPLGEKTLAARLLPRLRPDELLTADRGFYSWPAWDSAAAIGAALLWRAAASCAGFRGGDREFWEAQARGSWPGPGGAAAGRCARRMSDAFDVLPGLSVRILCL